MSKFCNACAVPLTAGVSSSPTRAKEQTLREIRVTPEQPGASMDWERKTVTAHFADLKGAMELLEKSLPIGTNSHYGIS
jgi:hypothetical protein